MFSYFFSDQTIIETVSRVMTGVTLLWSNLPWTDNTEETQNQRGSHRNIQDSIWKKNVDSETFHLAESSRHKRGHSLKLYNTIPRPLSTSHHMERMEAGLKDLYMRNNTKTID